MDKLNSSGKPEWARNLKLTIQPGGLMAELSLSLPKNAVRPTIDQLKAFLASSGITFGIKTDALLSLANKQINEGESLREIVAVGQNSEPPVEDSLEYLVSMPTAFRPKELPDGSVDLRDLNRITNVNCGDPLIRRIPGRKGKQGVTVKGEAIIPKAYRPMAVPVGLNTAISKENPNILVASCDGSIVRFGNFYNVYREYEVKGDIDYSTGNLELTGSALIKGSVRSGFTVKVSGNLRIEGDVEDAVIECGGSLAVNGGIIGRGGASIYAACGIEARYVNGHKLRTPGTIIIHEESVSATLQSGEDVIVGGRGVVAGGEVFVFREMNARVYGAESGVYTDIYFGFDTVLGGRQAEIRSLIEAMVTKDRLMKLEIYNSFKKGTQTDDKAILDKAKSERELLLEDYQKLDALEQEDAVITEQRLKNNVPSVVVRGTVYPGVKIASPVSQHFVKDKRSASGVFRVVNGEIVFQRV